MRAAGHLVTGVARRSPLPFSPGSAEAGWDTAEPDLSVCAVFSELSLADGGLRSADAETLEACQLLLIPRETVQRICHRVPLVAHALTSSLAATLRRLTEAASDLAFLDLPRRVAKVLHSQPRSGDGTIRPRLSQEELAHQAGGTRQSVNAALRGFQRRGWIEVHDRAVTIKQPAALGQFAGH
jgi:CRP/FNR family cyclic AMP-dependent transcriptional regulator